MELEITCQKCEFINTEKNIDYSNCCNEEGEDYYQFDLYCGKCNVELYEGGNWGEFDLEEAIDD
ncbi:hypothetical protein D3C84_945730 [compost metagenome]